MRQTKNSMWMVVLLLIATQARGERIAYTCDGNYHDKDDWGASAMVLALTRNHKVGLTHFDFNNHFPQHNLTYAQQHLTSVQGGQQRFGFNPALFYNRQVGNLALEINRSTATDRLTVVLAGPAEILWQALNKSYRHKRQYVTVLTHSGWNNNHEHPGTHNLADCVGVRVQRIRDQNAGLRTEYSRWYWMRDSPDPNLRWVYSRIVATKKALADVSDSGMIYYMLTGDQFGTPEKYRQWFGH